MQKKQKFYNVSDIGNPASKTDSQTQAQQHLDTVTKIWADNHPISITEKSFESLTLDEYGAS